MKFTQIQLGQGVHFDGQHRTTVVEKDYEMKSIKDPQGMIVTNRKTGEEHFISIFNIAYAKPESKGKKDDSEE